VRNSDKEIEIAQRAIYREIVLNGNRVVISFNQLTDSPAFLNLLQDEKTFRQLLGLFENGRFVISRYFANGEEKRTSAQYIIGAIERACAQSGDAFYFSGLPVVCGDPLLVWLGNSLKFSDPSFFTEKAEKAENPGEREKYKYLERYVKLILAISQNSLAYNPLKTELHISFSQIIDAILNRFCSTDSGHGPEKSIHLGADALQKLKNGTKGEINSRTNWLKALEAVSETMDDDVLASAECIIHLAYLYTVQESIVDVGKNYAEALDVSFMDEFRTQFHNWMNEYKEGVHGLHYKETNILEMHTNTQIHWQTAVRITRPARKRHKTEGMWWLEVLRGMAHRAFSAVFFVVFFVIIEIALGESFARVVTALTSLDINTESLLWHGVLTMISGMLSSAISRSLKLPDILESFQSFGTMFVDSFVIAMFRISIIRRRKHIDHFNRNAEF
jgi:hypothetical protein